MKTALVVDDHAHFRDFMAAALERDGFRVLAAANGADGLARLAAEPVDIVVTDIHMPESDALEMIRALRRQGYDLPVIAVTGAEARALQPIAPYLEFLGVRTILAKPCCPKRLREAVGEALRA